MSSTPPPESTHPLAASEGRLSSSSVPSDQKSLSNEKEGKTEATSEPQPVHNADNDFPDGGLTAWLNVVGAMCNTFATFGYVNSWGVFQSYYQDTLLKDTSPSNIAWIGAIQYSLLFLPSIFVGRLFDLGYFRSILISSMVTLVVATFLVPYCTQYWHFILCQGFAIGLPCGCVFAPTAAVIAHWFKKRRGLAMSLNAIGSSLGGTILPIVVKNLIPKVGFSWTMRILGFIILALLGIANFLMRRRLPPRKVAGGLFNWRAFKYAPFAIYCVSAFMAFQGVYTFLTYIAVSASELNLEGDLAFYFVAIANASSVFGRLLAGTIADKFGPMNVMVPFTLSAGVITYTWPFAETKGSLIAVTVLYGFTFGVYVSLVSNPALDFGGPEDVGRRVGMFLTCMAMGALAGPPIAGAIRTATGGFEAVGYYGGTTVVVGVGLMVLAKRLALGKWVGRL